MPSAAVTPCSPLGRGGGQYDGASTHASDKAFDADNTFGRGHAGHTIPRRQAAIVYAKTPEAAAALRAVKAGHSVAAAISGRYCQAAGVTASRAGRSSSHTACAVKADRAGS